MSNPILITTTEKAPYSKICHLVIYRKRFPKKDKFFNSTGFFIAKNFILTAAHNIHSQSFTKVDSIYISIGQYNEDQLFPTIKIEGLNKCRSHSYTPTEYSLAQKWESRIVNDYGLIYVPDSLLPNDFIWEEEFTLNTELITDLAASMAGYPADRNAGHNAQELYFQQEKITLQSSKVYKHSFKTQGGNSGSPVWIGEKNVIGIHTFEASGTLLDSEALKNIHKWMKEALN